MTIDVPTTGRSLPQLQPISFIGADGRLTDTPTAGLRMPSDRTLTGLYRQMVLVRRFEAQVTHLTRQGRLATYPSAPVRRPPRWGPRPRCRPAIGSSPPTVLQRRC